jgi:hypothetical protein
MKVEDVTPGDCLGDVIGDMDRRRGTIVEQVERGTNIAVSPRSRWSEMFGYIGQAALHDLGSRELHHGVLGTRIRYRRTTADEVIAEVAKRKAAANA